jgi:hypothetical protein
LDQRQRQLWVAWLAVLVQGQPVLAPRVPQELVRPGLLEQLEPQQLD